MKITSLLRKSLRSINLSRYGLLFIEYGILALILFYTLGVLELTETALKTGNRDLVLQAFPQLLLILVMMLALTFGLDLIFRAALFESIGKKRDMKRSLEYARKAYLPMLLAALIMFAVYVPVSALSAFIFSELVLDVNLSALLTLILVSAVNMPLYFVNPLLVIKKRGAIQAVKESIDLFRKKPKEVFAIFLVINAITYLVSAATIIPKIAMNVEVTLSEIAQPRYMMFFSYAQLVFWIAIIQVFVASFIDLLHISARANYLVGNKSK